MTAPVNSGWVARDAVNLDQPLRDPGQVPATPSAPSIVLGVTSPPTIAKPTIASPLASPAPTSSPAPYLAPRQPTEPSASQLPPSQSAMAPAPTVVETKPTPAPKVQPTLVLPKDRKPMPLKPELSKPTSSEPQQSVTRRETPVATPPQNDQDDSARIDRIVDRLLPAEGTAMGSIHLSGPKSSSPAMRSSTSQRSASSSTSSSNAAEAQPEKRTTDGSSQDIAADKDGGSSSMQRRTPQRLEPVDSATGLKSVPRTAAKQPLDASETVASKSRIEAQQAPGSYLGDLDPDEARVEASEPRPSPTISKVVLDYIGSPTEGVQPSPSTLRLQAGMKHVLNYYYRRPEKADARSNWGMLHSIMVYGTDTQIQVGHRNYNAIAWMAGNNLCRGQRLVENTPQGIRVKNGVGLQGHQAQMLAIFSLCGVPLEYPIYADGKQYTVADVVRVEMDACKSGEELTFTLIALSHYLEPEETWIAADGQTWSIERLIREELSQPIVGAACGGTHRLMGFSHALRNQRLRGKPITGQWARADAFIQDFVQYTFQLQNRDGSMSTNWFEGREDNGNVDRKIQTTGHVVEWLLTATPDTELEDPRLVAAIRFIINSMYRDLERDWSIGPKGHALRSLAMYHQRVFGTPAWHSSGVAKQSEPNSHRR